MLKAFLFDLDDTLTHVTDINQYAYGSHRSLQWLLGDRTPDRETYSELHLNMWKGGLCHFTGMAEQYTIDRAQFFQGHHDLIDESFVIHDTDSADALNGLKGRALVYTDGARSWAQRRLDMLGVSLPIQARDDHPKLFERKAHSVTRLTMALDELRSMTGDDLQPEEVLMFDDSASVLRFVQSQGFKTAYCHFGTPGRSGNGGFDFEVQQVGKFLHEQGFIAAAPAAKSAGPVKASPK